MMMIFVLNCTLILFSMYIVFLFAEFDELTYSALPRDSGVGEGSWAGLSFSPSQWSTVLEFFKKNADCDLYHSIPFHLHWRSFELDIIL